MQTGFHPLDGARFLRCAGVDGQVVSLVAYHSSARVEADVRSLGAELAAEFTPAAPLLTDALLYCDMTTGPDGDYVRPADRLAEIWSPRSARPPPVSRCCIRARRAS